MPTRAKQVCHQPGCGALCDGGYCASHVRVAHGRFDRERGSACKRGYGRRHEKWRKLILARDPLCKIAHFCHGMSPSTVADHIVPLSRGGDWSMENGQGACAPCHNWKTAGMKSQTGSLLSKKEE